MDCRFDSTLCPTALWMPLRTELLELKLPMVCTLGIECIGQGSVVYEMVNRLPIYIHSARVW
jgi:hypothetical protein